MNVINFKVDTTYFPTPTVLVDGKALKLKSTSAHNYTCRVETEAESVNVCACKAFELGGKFWFLIAIAYFIFTVFGIFDAFYDKKFYAVNFQTELKLNETNNVEITFNKFESGKRALVCRSDCSAEETANEYFIDETIKKRYKFLRKVKLITWGVLAAAAIVAIILAFTL